MVILELRGLSICVFGIRLFDDNIFNMDFKQLPKIDLHLHLDGAIRVATIAELGDELGIKLPSYDPKELAKFVQVNRA